MSLLEAGKAAEDLSGALLMYGMPTARRSRSATPDSDHTPASFSNATARRWHLCSTPTRTVFGRLQRTVSLRSTCWSSGTSSRTALALRSWLDGYGVSTCAEGSSRATVALRPMGVCSRIGVAAGSSCWDTRLEYFLQ